jgi:hypothetical protein
LFSIFLNLEILPIYPQFQPCGGEKIGAYRLGSFHWTWVLAQKMIKIFSLDELTEAI